MQNQASAQVTNYIYHHQYVVGQTGITYQGWCTEEKTQLHSHSILKAQQVLSRNWQSQTKELSVNQLDHTLSKSSIRKYNRRLRGCSR